MKGQARYGRSLEPTKIEKSEVRTPTKTRPLEKQKKHEKQKNVKKRDHHQSMRIQAKFDVFQQFNDRKNKKNMKKRVVEKHEKARFGAHFGRPKVIQNDDFFET